MNIARSFVEINQRCSDWMVRHFPRMYDYSIPEIRKVLLQSIQTELSFNTDTLTSILEVGGIDRPLWKKSSENKYDGLDVCYSPKCQEVYDHFFIQSVEEKINEKYDLVFSITVLEHVPNNSRSVSSIYEALNKGGYTVHYIPNGNHPYSLILRAVGSKGQRWLLKHFISENVLETQGYPAFFNHCSPSKMKNLFEKIGFNEISVQCFYRANQYFAFFFPLFIIASLWDYFCRITNFKAACSGFIISARK